MENELKLFHVLLGDYQGQTVHYLITAKTVKEVITKLIESNINCWENTTRIVIRSPYTLFAVNGPNFFRRLA